MSMSLLINTHCMSHLEVEGHHCAVCQTSKQKLPATVEAEDSVRQSELLLQLSRL